MGLGILRPGVPRVGSPSLTPVFNVVASVRITALGDTRITASGDRRVSPGA